MLAGTRSDDSVIVASAYGVGEIVGFLILVSIVFFAVRDQVRKRGRR